MVPIWVGKPPDAPLVRLVIDRPDDSGSCGHHPRKDGIRVVDHQTTVRKGVPHADKVSGTTNPDLRIFKVHKENGIKFRR
jgi:hypothetical protein